MQFKGQTSYRKPAEMGSEKLSFSVLLDELIDGQDIDGYNNFNFNNAFQDFSFMKEVEYARLSVCLCSKILSAAKNFRHFAYYITFICVYYCFFAISIIKNE